MAKIEREYYSINEASEIIGCSVADLVHLAARGDIRFVVLTSGLPAQQIKQKIINRTQRFEAISDKFCYVSQDNVAEYEANHSNDYLKISWVYTDDDLENGWGLREDYSILMTNDSLYMLTADIDVLMDGVAIESPALINHAGTEPKERELMAWLRETWINEGSKLGGTAFFIKLKKYVNKDGSPIVEHYSAGKSAGFRWETSAGATGTTTKKTILNIVSVFKNTP